MTPWEKQFIDSLKADAAKVNDLYDQQGKPTEDQLQAFRQEVRKQRASALKGKATSKSNLVWVWFTVAAAAGLVAFFSVWTPSPPRVEMTWYLSKESGSARDPGAVVGSKDLKALVPDLDQFRIHTDFSRPFLWIPLTDASVLSGPLSEDLNVSKQKPGRRLFVGTLSGTNRLNEVLEASVKLELQLARSKMDLSNLTTNDLEWMSLNGRISKAADKSQETPISRVQVFRQPQ